MVKKMTKARWKDLLFYAIVLAWPITQFCVFYVGVNINSVLMAFQSTDAATNTTKFVWFENFERLFDNIQNDVLYIGALKNSLKFWAQSLFIAMPVGLLFSYYIYKKKPFGAFYQVILFMPSILAAMVLATMYQYFVDWYIPDIANKTFNTEFPRLFSTPENTFNMVLLYSLWFSFGTSSLMYLGAMNGISESVIEAGKIDGANSLQEFIFIILPQIFSTISVFIVVGIAGIFTVQGGLFEFFGEKAANEYHTIGYFMFAKALSADMHNYLAAMGIVVTIIIAPTCMILRKVFAKIDPMN